MALFKVSGYQPHSELRSQILPGGQTNLIDRTNHYTFGTKAQEFAVPLGLDVSIVSPGFIKMKRLNHHLLCKRQTLCGYQVNVAQVLSVVASVYLLLMKMSFFIDK